MTPIKKLATGIRVERLQDELDDAPFLWGANDERTRQYAHSDVTDIWVRCAATIGEMRGDKPAPMLWYPAIEHLPSLHDIIWPVIHCVRGEELGGILITKIPPGGAVQPHVDFGWHAHTFDKFAVQVKGDDRQRFCFTEAELITNDGDLFTFNNSLSHWVKNDSDRERITLILCIKTSFTEKRVRS